MSELSEHKINRAGWESGPWDHEPDKLNWKTEAGLPGMIVRNNVGALCGYVAVTKDHPWFGHKYNHGEEYSESPEGIISVHGGLTYSDSCTGHICHMPEPGEPDDVWWFGFDCNHGGDQAPKSSVYQGLFPDLGGPFGKYRDLAYVRAEVESLARQLGVPQTSTEESK